VKREDAARPFFTSEIFATVLGAAGQSITKAAAPQLTLLTRADHHDFITGTATDAVVAEEELRYSPPPSPPVRPSSIRWPRRSPSVFLSSRRRPRTTARVIAFNASGVARSDVAEMELPIAGGVVPPLHALANGQPVPLEVVGTPLPTDTTATLRLGFTAMAPFSWSAVDILPGAAAVAPAVTLSLEDATGAPATGANVTRVVLSNANVVATLNQAASGFELTSLVLGGRRPSRPAPESSTTTRIKEGSGASATRWPAAPLTPITEPALTESVEVVDTPGLVGRVVFHSAAADREVSLAAGASGLSFAITTGAAEATTRTVSFDLAVPSGAALTTDEPAGWAVRPAEYLYTPTFWSAVGWAQVGGVAILLRQSTGFA